MKKFKIYLLSILCFLAFSTGAKAEFFSDVIVTSANGIWTDSRAYATLNAAITAVGSNQRTVVIVGTQTVTSLTVPSNVTLKFERDGMITNTGQLTIQTKNIIAENRRIFTGPGNIDFASGTVLQSGWFNNIESAFAVTTNDTVTLIVSKPQTITASYSPGDNVYLKWDAPGNILTVNAGVTVSNIGQVTAGNYQLFAGAGNFRFRDGTILNLYWFNNLRAAITYASTNKLTLLVQGTHTVDLSDSVPSTLTTKMVQGGVISISPGVTLTYANARLIDIDSYGHDPFAGTGSVAFTGGLTYSPASGLTALTLQNLSNVGYEVDALITYGGGVNYTQATIEAALTAIGTTNKATLLLRPGTWVISSSANWSAYTNVTFKMPAGAILQIATGTTTTISGPLEAGLYQIFSCVGTGAVSGLSYVNPVWFGMATTETATNNTAAVNATIAAVSGTATNSARLFIPNGEYTINANPTGGRISLKSYMTIEFQSRSAKLKADALDGVVPTGILYASGKTDITIRGGTLEGEIDEHTGAASESTMGIFLSNCDNILIDDMEIYDNSGDGVYVGTNADYSQNVRITRSNLHDNGRHGVGAVAVVGLTLSESKATSNALCGVDVEPGGGETVDKIKIVNNEFASNDVGICVIAGSLADVVIQGNTVDSSTSEGIRFKYCDGGVISGNHVYSSGEEGIHLWGSGTNKSYRTIVTGNNVHSNGYSGIKLTEVQQSTVGQNIVYNNGYHGIHLIYDTSVCDNNVISGNVVCGNSQDTDATYDGISVGQGSHYNTIIGNRVHKGAATNKQRYGINTGINEYNMVIGNYIVDGGSTLELYQTGFTMVESNRSSVETITGNVDLRFWGVSYLDSSGGAITATLNSDPAQIGVIKIIKMTNATASSTLSVAKHETSAPEVFTFADVGDTLILMWNGTVWVTISNVGCTL